MNNVGLMYNTFWGKYCGIFEGNFKELSSMLLSNHHLLEISRQLEWNATEI